MPFLAGECLSPSPGVEEVTGRAVVMREMWLLLSKCLEGSWVLHHSTDPFPVALLPLGPTWPTAPGGSVTSHHFHCLPLAAMPPLIIFGCPRSVRRGLAAPPAPTEQQGLITQCCGVCCPSLSPARPAAPSPKAGSCWGSPSVDARAALPHSLSLLCHSSLELSRKKQGQNLPAALSPSVCS